jgi:ankyrin repeat protein
MSGIVQTVVREFAALRAAHPALSDLLGDWSADVMHARALAHKREHGMSVLHSLIASHRESELRGVLAAPPPFDLTVALADVSDGSSALGLAASIGNSAMVGLLLAAGAPEALAKGEKIDPIEHAVIGGHLEVVQQFGNAGSGPVAAALHALQATSDPVRWKIFVHLASTMPNINTPNSDGVQTLMLAVDLGLEQCAIWLLQNCPGIDVNNGRALPDRTPLLTASRYGMTSCVRLLLNFPGLDVNWTDTAGRGAAFAALRGGHLHVLRALMGDRRTFANSRHGPRSTPLLHAAVRHAAFKQRPELLECMLMKKHVNWAAADETGTTAIHWLMREMSPNNRPGVDTASTRAITALLLKQAPATVDHLSEGGENALVACVTSKWASEMLLMLLEHSKMYLTRFTVDHPELLHIAAKTGRFPMCLILMACGYQSHMYAGRTPAMVADFHGHALLGNCLRDALLLPPLQLAAMAGLNRAHLNHEIGRGAIQLPLNVPWVDRGLLSRPASATPLAYIHRLRQTNGLIWTRMIHHSFPVCFKAAAVLLLLCIQRRQQTHQGLPTEMCHAILALLPRRVFCTHN